MNSVFATTRDVNYLSTDENSSFYISVIPVLVKNDLEQVSVYFCINRIIILLLIVSAAYYRGANGALIVYDITNQESFDNLEKWFKEIENQGENGCINILIGNKCDLNHLRQVETATGRAFAEKHNVPFMETSALDSTNVDEAFTTLLKEIYKTQSRKNKKTEETTGDVPIGPTDKVIIDDTNDDKKPGTKPQQGGSGGGCAC